MPFKPKKKDTRPHIQYSQGRVGNFYSQAAWRKLREYKLRLNPICEHCQQRDEGTPAVMVDHIKPIIEGGEPLELSNLQSLCDLCHRFKSGKETAKRK